MHLDPQYALAYYTRGFAYQQLGQMQRANQDFDKAIRLGPKLEAAVTVRFSLRNASHS